MKQLLLIALIAFAPNIHAQLIPQTQLEQDLSNITRAANGTTYYAQLLVQSLNAAHSAVWTLPDDRLTAVLNRLGADQVAALIALHGQTAAALNLSLDAAGDTGARAIVSPSREYTITAAGTITVTPLPTQE